MSSVLVIAAAVVGLRRVVLPPLLAAGLAIAAIATLAGGLIRVGHDVLYNAAAGPYSPSLGTHFLQYDHFAHATAASSSCSPAGSCSPPRMRLRAAAVN